MIPTARRREETEGGAVLVIFAVALVVLVGMISIAVDLSYGFVQNRRAQNATDFAAFAATQELAKSTYCTGQGDPSMAQITGIIQQLVDANDSSVGTGWTAQFLDSYGHTMSGSTFSPSSYPTDPPPGACGVTITAAPTWTPFFSGIFGIRQMKGFASSAVNDTEQGTDYGIIALNKAGPHEVLGGGTGQFLVEGNMFLNTDVTNQPWTGSAGGYEWDDAVDAKTDSNLYVYGTIDTVDTTYEGEPLWPLDTCFQPTPFGFGTVTSPSSPANGSLPWRLACTQWGGSVNIGYDSIYPKVPQISDPLQASGAPPNPYTDSNIGCPGVNNGTPVTYGSIPTNQAILTPGIYTKPVHLTGSVNFTDCSGFGNGEGDYPGIYRFEQGLWIDPGGGQTVAGSNVVISTGTPYPLAGNVPGTGSGTSFTATGTGNGAPCLPAGTMTSAPSGHGTPEAETTSAAPCGGTNPQTYGVISYGDTTYVPNPSLSGTGNNFSLIIGGAGTVSFTGPSTGPWAGAHGTTGLVFYQDPNTQANYGFDAESGDSATITITGAVYNGSLSNYGANAPQDYWDGVGGGIPFYAGGTLQTGFGAGWASPPGPAESTGSVTIDGTAIVDDFNTDGKTDITIVGAPYTLPGGGQLSLVG
ncbi:MAG TPA: Tad domain-containing protein [Acidimicrobiales bacterium]|nr:Tad domain-containing protein [Acidimicrobiales bacterium]